MMRIVLGVTGGIAAYKACELASRLMKESHEVQVVMTKGAAQFIAPLTFSALTHRPVAIAATDEPQGPLSHVKLAQWANGMIVAPASANVLARFATGLAQDMLELVYLGFRGPILMAPAMEPQMWQHPRTQHNVDVLSADGVQWVGPTHGRMASGAMGIGRMAEPIEILEKWRQMTAPQDLSGTRIVVTAGPTWEHFDPVRLLTNPSTGQMGVWIAHVALQRGAEVILIHGPGVQVPDVLVDHAVAVISAQDMLYAVQREAPSAQVIIGAAAVSDFRPAKPLSHKAHKDEVEDRWDMVPNPDILKIIGQQYAGQKILVGFAAETDGVIESAHNKRQNKKLDAVVANLVGSGRGFGHGAHKAWMVTADDVKVIPGDHKSDTASAVLDWVAGQLAKRRGQGNLP